MRLTTKEAAKFIGVSEGTLRNLRIAGGGPRFIKLGRKVLYDQRDIEDWLEDHKRMSTADEKNRRRRRRVRTPSAFLTSPRWRDVD